MGTNAKIFAALLLTTASSAKANDVKNDFLFSEEQISRYSDGKFVKRSAFLWNGTISLIVLGDDERKKAAAFGFLTSQTRFLNIKLENNNPKNFILFTDKKSIDKFIEQVINKLNESKPEIENLKNNLTRMSSCQTNVSGDQAGRIKTVFSANMFEYGTTDFSGCLQMMGLRAFGISLENNYFADRTDRDPAKAFEFLTDIYRHADREQPFASISAR